MEITAGVGAQMLAASKNNYMKYFQIFILLIISFNIVGQTINEDLQNIIFDKNIKKEVEKRIITEFEGFGKEFIESNRMSDDFLIYKNPVYVELYESDTLAMSTNDQNRSLVFKSFYYTLNDTLSIDGAYGLFGGFGFSLKIIDKKYIVYHLVASDEIPGFSLNKDDSLKFRVEVPCTDTKLILSDFPKLSENETVYGYVEFKSGSYYQSGPTIDGEEIEERKKIKMDMRIYFKSQYLDLRNIEQNRLSTQK